MDQNQLPDTKASPSQTQNTAPPPAAPSAPTPPNQPQNANPSTPPPPEPLSETPQVTPQPLPSHSPLPTRARTPELKQSDIPKAYQQAPNESQPTTPQPAQNIATSQIPAVRVDQDDIEPPKSKKGLKIFIALLVISSLLVSGFVGVSLAAAYERLPFEQPQLKNIGTVIILNVPFFPKTLEQVALASILAHQEVASAGFTASLATKSDSLTSFLNINSINIEVSGDVEIIEEELQGILNINLDNYFEADLITNATNTYFKINQLPEAMLAFIGMSQIPDDAGILNQWVDATHQDLETSASELLDEKSEDSNFFDESLEAALTSLYQDSLKPITKLTKTDNTYRIALNLEGQPINDLVKAFVDAGQKTDTFSVIDTDDILPSDVLKNIQLDIYIDATSYFLKNATLYIRYDNSAIIDQYAGIEGILPALQKEQSEIAFTLELENVGQPITITPPSDAIPLDEYGTKVFGLMSSGAGMASANDTQRRADLYTLTNAIYQYAAENNNTYPVAFTNEAQDAATLGLEAKLVPTYIEALPKDPGLDEADPNTGYYLHINEQNQLVATASAQTPPGDIITVTR